MTIEISEYVGRPLACQWCGNVRNKKIFFELDGERCTVCEKHLLSVKGARLDKANIAAVKRVWANERNRT